MSTFSELIDFTRSSTGTYLGSDGLIKTANVDEPRLEYDASGQPLGLLIEEQRTNLVSNSSFSSAWSGGGYIKTANATIAPDGTNTATKIAWDNTTSYHSIFNTYSVSAQTAYTRSVYAKASELSWIYVQHYDSGGGANNNGGVYFDVANGVKGTESSGHTGIIEDIGNGWYRCSVAYTTSTGTTTERLQVALTTGDNVFPNNLTGDGVSGVFLWGAQLEAGAFPTSYIPTSGSTVTRNSDVCSLPLERYHHNAQSYTMYAEFESTPRTPSNFERVWALSNDASPTNYVQLQFNTVNKMQVYSVYNDAANMTGNMGNIEIADTTNKIALKVGGTSLSLACNGILRSGALTNEIENFEKLHIGIANSEAFGWINTHIKVIRSYAKGYTNAQLIELTKPSSSPTMSLTFDGQATSELVEGLHD